MIIVKLIVLFCCGFNGFSSSPTDYCEICLNHTLCKYKTQGPSPSCKSYDSSALLTSRDINELVKRINERRNFVAMGYSKILPQAANMKRIHWSNELATFAQRWADQCDPFIRPDKEDQCRDLGNAEVGQNIGSVLGFTAGLSIKGFVEMWFIQVLDYTGSVTYYNKSRDYKTSYLTQLIWANTEFVGCGKAKFYVDERNVMVERLVCNFAPKGNSHGKPVYSIGYPGTQCKNKIIPNDKYKGLCGYEDDSMFTKLNNQRHPTNSLLRILNLSNDSVKHEIDPIRNNFKQNNVNSNSSNEQRNPKTRHILSNKTYAAVKRIPQLRKQMFGHSIMNFSKNNNEYRYQHDRGHSHLYHGHDTPRYNYETTAVINTNHDFRIYDDSSVNINSNSNTNNRRFNQYAQCTRKTRPIQDNCASNHCSRASDDCCSQTTTMCPATCTEMFCTQPIEDHTCATPYIPSLPDSCVCTQPTCPPISTNCNYNTNCPCSIPCSTNTCYLTTICPGGRRLSNDFNDYRKASTFQYYDMIPNVVVRSGNHKIPQENSSQKSKSDINKSYKTIYDEIDSDQIHKGMSDIPKYQSQDRDYLYHSFESGLRHRRQIEDQLTMKPFWQIETTFNYQKPPELKSMRYTTLLNKKNRKMPKNFNSAKWLMSTEPITLRLADYDEFQPEHVTEKYLSFNELMHLRKISDGYAQYDLRRQGKTTAKPKPASKAPNSNKGNSTKPAGQGTKKSGNSTQKQTKATTKTNTTTKRTTLALTTTSTIKTTEYTANTPFIRKKHCTRKLTCTWTAFSANANANEGGDAPVFGPIEIGSRTPPGYVEGCTRTSTCTRDFMDRNKISTLPNENLSESTLEDEDYCERRSLNVKRRNSDTKKLDVPLLKYRDYTDISTKTAAIISDAVFNTNKEGVIESISKAHGCICNKKYARKKRDETKCSRGYVDKYDNSEKSLSYSSLFYLILNKILRANKANQSYNNQCPCNGSVSSSPITLLYLIIYLRTLYFMVYHQIYK